MPIWGVLIFGRKPWTIKPTKTRHSATRAQQTARKARFLFSMFSTGSARAHELPSDRKIIGFAVFQVCTPMAHISIWNEIYILVQTWVCTWDFRFAPVFAHLIGTSNKFNRHGANQGLHWVCTLVCTGFAPYQEDHHGTFYQGIRSPMCCL